MLIQAGLCRTCSKTTLLVFQRGGSFNVSAKPVVELANKTGTEPYSRFTRNNIITGFEDKNLTVFCSATGGRPMPKVEILVNNSAIEDIDFPDERVETKRVESDQTTTGG